MGTLLDGEGALEFGSVAAEHAAVRTGVGLLDRSARGFLGIAGRDARTWLQGLVSNDVRMLDEKHPSLATCILNATGHILSDAVILLRGDALMLDLPAWNRTKVFEWLQQYIITEDVEIVDWTGWLACVSVQGPGARNVALQEAGGAVVVPADHTGEAGYDVYLAAAEAAELWERLRRQGCTPVGEYAAEVLRIEAGIPRYGLELTEDVFPMECGLQSTHISTSKGCYVGQEVIARILSRGHTNRTLAGLLLDGDEAPEPGTAVEAMSAAPSGHAAGMVTSSCNSLSLGAPVALAVLRREFSRPGQRLVTRTGQKVLVTELPFVRRERS